MLKFVFVYAPLIVLLLGVGNELEKIESKLISLNSKFEKFSERDIWIKPGNENQVEKTIWTGGSK